MNELAEKDYAEPENQEVDLAGVVNAEQAKILKIERERAKLLSALESGSFKELITRVAYILNMYPKSRDSDITLALNYWQTYQPDLYNHTGILPQHFYALERQTNLSRARAKIQNEFKLFLATEEVKKHRNAKQEVMEAAVIDSQTPRPVIKIFADESGKQGDQNSTVLVGSVWFYNGAAMARLAMAIDKWRAGTKWEGKELHFNDLKRNDVDAFKAYVDLICSNREFMSIKCIGVKKSRVAARPIENVVKSLNEILITKGLDHEVETGRVSLPRRLSIAIDKECSIDAIALNQMKNEVENYTIHRFGQDVVVEDFVSVDSSISEFIQLADVIVASINRKLNTAGENHKDECADYLIGMLDIDLTSDKEGYYDTSILLSI